jgi:hypothetical protein
MRRYGLVFRDAEDLEIASDAPNGKNSKPIRGAAA